MNEDYDNNENRGISKEAFGVLAFLLGALGIHDFAARRYFYGCGHLALTALAIGILGVNQSNFLSPTLIFGSWVWAIVENSFYQKNNGSVVVRKDETNGCLVFAKTAEVFICLTILSGVIAIIMTIQSRNWACKDTSCGWSKGLAVVLPIMIGIFMLILSTVFTSIALSRRKALSEAHKQNNNVLQHTKVMTVLGIFLILTIVLLILAIKKVI